MKNRFESRFEKEGKILGKLFAGGRQRLEKKDSSQGGFILIDAIFSVQILLLLVLLLIISSLYYRSVTLDNSYRQAALYALETELELYLTEQRQNYEVTGTSEARLSEKIVRAGSRGEIEVEIKLDWQLLTDDFAEIWARASWSRPGLLNVQDRELELYTSYYLR